MTSIKFPPHNKAIPVTFTIEGQKRVVLLQPSDQAFTLDLPESAQLVGEFGVEPMTVDSVSDRTQERLG